MKFKLKSLAAAGMRFVRLAAILPLIFGSSLTGSHELEADLLTVVVRDAKHISLTFRVDEVNLMHRMLAPNSSLAEFLLPLSAMSDDAFSRVVLNFRSRFEHEVQLRDAMQASVPLNAWRWPEIADSRSLLRRLTMTRLVGGETHEHLPPTVITADGVSREEAKQLELLLPGALDGITVVHYQPSQRTWRSREGSIIGLTF